MTIEQFKKLKKGDKVIIDGNENEVIVAYDCDQVEFRDVINIYQYEGVYRISSTTVDYKLDPKTVENLELITGNSATAEHAFNFSTLKDNTFCIYDVKEGQADKIKGIMEELGITGNLYGINVYYFADNYKGSSEYQVASKTAYDNLRKTSNETYRKTATEFLKEYAEWKLKEYDNNTTKLFELEAEVEKSKPFYSKFIGKKYAVHCETQGEWDRVCEALKYWHDLNFCHWEEGYQEKTCRGLDKPCFWRPREYFECKGRDYTILSVAEFFGEEEKPKIEDTALYNNAMVHKESINKHNKIKKTMETLKNGVLKLTDKVKKTLKRLSPEYRDLYRAGYINGDLEETEKYDAKMLELQREEYREQIAGIANTEINEAEKEAKEAKK